MKHSGMDGIASSCGGDEEFSNHSRIVPLKWDDWLN